MASGDYSFAEKLWCVQGKTETSNILTKHFLLPSIAGIVMLQWQHVALPIVLPTAHLVENLVEIRDKCTANWQNCWLGKAGVVRIWTILNNLFLIANYGAAVTAGHRGSGYW